MRIVYTLAFGLLLTTFVAAGAGPMITTQDLSADARLASNERLPVMLVFSREDCPYCRLLEEEFLQPMRISGDYEHRVVIRTLEIDTHQIADFNGTPISAADLADRYRVTLTPTILFLNAKGEELTKRLVGLGTLDYFSADIDSGIDAALLSLRH